MSTDQDIEPFVFRPARAADLTGIADVKSLTWPEEPIRLDCIARALSSDIHTIMLVEHAGKTVGFVDGFTTPGPTGMRWEVDLLAVAPTFRGMGLGKALVGESCRSAWSKGVRFCRALIQVNNIQSQRSFLKNGFQPAESIYRLFINATPHPQPVQPAADGRLLQVTTLNYSGVWIESSYTPADLLAARFLLFRKELDLAGALIPIEQEETSRTALGCSYHPQGDYQWWHKELTCGGTEN